MKYLSLFILILNAPNLLLSQLNKSSYSFDECIQNNQIDKTCNDLKMKNFIFEQIIKNIPESELQGKKNLILNLTTNKDSEITQLILSWKDETGPYLLKTLKTNVKKIQNFNSTEDFNAVYRFSENLDSETAKIYLQHTPWYTRVEVMPKIDFEIINSEIEKNIKYGDEAIKNNYAMSLAYRIFIDMQGYLVKVEVPNQDIKYDVDKAFMLAFEKIIASKLKFQPGFQRHSPVNVFTISYFPLSAEKK
jgi:hypothetical protein